MTAAQFMPGPWEVVEATSLKYVSSVIFRYASGEAGTVAMVGRVGVTVGDSDLDRQNATAHLIAAAPDLLALGEAAVSSMEERLVETLESHCLLDEHLQPIRSTLEEDVRDYVEGLEMELASARALIAKARSDQ